MQQGSSALQKIYLCPIPGGGAGPQQSSEGGYSATLVSTGVLFQSPPQILRSLFKGLICDVALMLKGLETPVI